MTQKKSKRISLSIQNWTPILWAMVAVLLVALLFARTVFAEWAWVTILVSVALLANTGALLQQNRKALRSRTAAFGLNSAITIVLVVGLLGVVNFLGARYPKKIDLTSAGLNTLSDQTVKAVKSLSRPVQAVFWVKPAEREKYRTLLEGYKALNTQFQLEYVDPDQSISRAREAGIKRYGTLQLKWEGKESKVEEPTEEKLTNALIKLTRSKTTILCAITGHGERSFSGGTAEGWDSFKKGVEEQSYTVREFNLVTDAKDGKIPADCNALFLNGPTKPLFAPEVQILRNYLAQGGRMVVAADLPLRGTDPMADLAPVFADWHIKVVSGLVIDPRSKMLGSDAAVPIVSTFNPGHPLTKEFQTQCFFPFTRPVEVIPGAHPQLTTQWLAQSSAGSLVVTDLKQLASGQVRIQPGKDAQMARQIAVAAEGLLKDAKPDTRKTRLVVFGSAQFGNNQWSRFGGNLDLTLNAVSWVVEDDSLISIRSKEDRSGKIELSESAGNVIGNITLFVMPLLISCIGIGVWYFRRKM